MVTPVDPNSGESPEQKRERRKKERLGGCLFLFIGVVVIGKSMQAVTQHGLGAWVAGARPGRMDLPWWVTLLLGLFGIAGGLYGLIGRR